MPDIVLLISRDKNLQHTRSLVFKSAGYRTICLSSLEAALLLARAHMADLIVLGQSFSVNEQRGFIESIARHHAALPIVCLSQGIVEPPSLLRECARLLKYSTFSPAAMHDKPNTVTSRILTV